MNQEILLQEQLLFAWMRMSTLIRGNRILSELSFNEIMICGLLMRQQDNESAPLTATDLCAQTSLLKSQVNHILTSLENRALIRRVRATHDKRIVYVYLMEAGRALYVAEHARVMEILKQIYHELGREKTRELTQLISKATTIVDQHQRTNKE